MDGPDVAYGRAVTASTTPRGARLLSAETVLLAVAATGTSLVASTGTLERATRIELWMVAGALALILVTCVVARLVLWWGIGGPWWRAMESEGREVDATARRIDRDGAGSQPWAVAGLRTASALHGDNTGLCRRMDREARRRARSWSGAKPDPADPDNPIGPMWKSLADGEAKLTELCHELRAQLGRYLVGLPVRAYPPGPSAAEGLLALTDRLRALGAARAEVEGVARRAKPKPSRTIGNWDQAGLNLVALVRAKAPEVAEEAAEAWGAAARAHHDAATSHSTLDAQIRDFPPEAPEGARRAHAAPRQARIKELIAYLRTLEEHAAAAVAAAVDLPPREQPPKRQPHDIDRPAVAAAEGMIALLRDISPDPDEP